MKRIIFFNIALNKFETRERIVNTKLPLRGKIYFEFSLKDWNTIIFFYDPKLVVKLIE